jgi:hypothetical protein
MSDTNQDKKESFTENQHDKSILNSPDLNFIVLVAFIVFLICMLVLCATREGLMPANASQIGQRVFDNSETVSIPNQWYRTKKIPYML